MLESTPKVVPAIDCQAVETAPIPTLNRPILNGINLTIYPGEFVTLLGLNGAGKSTLLRSLVGLVPLQKGIICINGTPVLPRTLAQIRQSVGLLFQGGALVRQLSAIENVLCGRLGSRSAWQTLTGFSKADRRAALDLLAQLGLKEQAYQRTGQLSGGQQQRVAIARALMQSPKILLVDEPITGLDVLAAQQVMDTLVQLQRERGMTIVAVLHDLTIAATYGQRAIVLDRGEVVHDGSNEKLLDRFVQLSQLTVR